MTIATTGDVRTELLEARRDLARIRTQNDLLIAANRDLSSLLSASSQLSGELLRTIVAFRRLLEAPDSSATLRNIEEILVNIIGTEDFVVLVVTEQPAMRAVAGMGPALQRAKASPLTQDALAAGSARVVPLRIDERVVGAIVIDNLLPHRDAISGSDEQVLALLSSFAATAILAAEQRQGWTRLHVAGVA